MPNDNMCVLVPVNNLKQDFTSEYSGDIYLQGPKWYNIRFALCVWVARRLSVT